MNLDQIRTLQSDLKHAGFDPGPLDGVWGNRTAAAVIAFKKSIGFVATAYVGLLTLAALAEGKRPSTDDPIHESKLPWIVEAIKVIGLHETSNNTELRNWLKSDGSSIGDPSLIAWCGDFVQTAIRLGLPMEAVPSNPFWALNWRTFGVSCGPVFGAVASISREGGGHVGFLVGQDATRYYLLGGNQSNRTSVSPVDKKRFVPESFRFPKTWKQPPDYLPTMTSAEASNINEG